MRVTSPLWRGFKSPPVHFNILFTDFRSSVGKQLFSLFEDFIAVEVAYESKASLYEFACFFGVGYVCGEFVIVEAYELSVLIIR
jgi:hypothetical protein